MNLRDRLKTKIRSNKFNLNLVKHFNLKRNDLGKYRTYETPTGKYPSITSVLGAGEEQKKFLKEWRKNVGDKVADKISETAARNGTYVHNCLESYINGNSISTFNSQFQQIRKLLDKYVNNISGIEIQLYSQTIGIAGTADLVAEYDGVLSLIDYKTSKNNKPEEWILNYFIQCCFYSLAFEELYNIKVEQIVILIGVENAVKPQVFIRKRRDYIQDLIKIKNTFDKLYKEK